MSDTVEQKKPAKKKRVIIDADTRTVALARVRKLVEAGNSVTKATTSVAKEFNIAESTIMNWRTAERKLAQKIPKKKVVSKTTEQVVKHESNGSAAPLDIALDMLELANKARNSLGDASRKRLLKELQTRLA